jgi:hypothetical protein
MLLLYIKLEIQQKGDAIPTTLAKHREICPQITIPETSGGTEITIMQKDVTEIHRTLGCNKNVINDNKYHGTNLKKKSETIGNNAKNSDFSRKQGWMALNGSYIPAIKFSLPAMSFTKEEIDKIRKYTIDKFLSKIGYAHSMHRSIVFGPINMDGLGLKHLFTEMMEMKIVMSHIRANSRLGYAFRINIDYLQLVSGLTKPIFESKVPIEYIKSNWLFHIRDY